MSAAEIPMIGIVGGIGSGKTTLANALQQYFRCQRLDADVAGHQALRRSDVKTELAARFGHEILDDNGEIRRSALAAKVFGNEPEKLTARRQLEAVVHPVIRENLLDEKKRIEEAGECELLLMDAALMFESGLSKLCDAVVFLDVPQSARVMRVRERGWSEEELSRREASQMPLEKKRELSDFSIDQSGTVEESSRQLAEWIHRRFPRIHCKSLLFMSQPTDTNVLAATMKPT